MSKKKNKKNQGGNNMESENKIEELNVVTQEENIEGVQMELTIEDNTESTVVENVEEGINVSEEITEPTVEENIYADQVVVNEEESFQPVEEENVEDITPSEEESHEEEIQNEENFRIGVVVPAFLNVRKEASKDSDIVTIINKDDEVAIVEELEEFYKVNINGFQGFCVKDFISVK